MEIWKIDNSQFQKYRTSTFESGNLKNESSQFEQHKIEIPKIVSLQIESFQIETLTIWNSPAPLFVPGVGWCKKELAGILRNSKEL